VALFEVSPEQGRPSVRLPAGAAKPEVLARVATALKRAGGRTAADAFLTDASGLDMAGVLELATRCTDVKP
jgi:hypothetical protein